MRGLVEALVGSGYTVGPAPVRAWLRLRWHRVRLHMMARTHDGHWFCECGERLTMHMRIEDR